MLSSIGPSRASGVENPTSDMDSSRPTGDAAAAKKKAASKSQRNRAWNQMTRNVEKVTDTIGEQISDEFFDFLETWVPSFSSVSPSDFHLSLSFRN
jgi:hypothetical protein